MKKNTYKKYVKTTTGTEVVGVFNSSTNKLIQWLPKQGQATKGRSIKPSDGEVLDLLQNDSIPYPKELSEFEIQSYIYYRLKDMGYDIRGEVTSKRRICRFDLIIFRHKLPFLIIEVKRKKVEMSDKQKFKYSCYPVPLQVITNFEVAKRFVDNFPVLNPISLPNTKYNTSI